MGWIFGVFGGIMTGNDEKRGFLTIFWRIIREKWISSGRTA